MAGAVCDPGATEAGVPRKIITQAQYLSTEYYMETVYYTGPVGTGSQIIIHAQ
jgi:hypothetical protein